MCVTLGQAAREVRARLLKLPVLPAAAAVPVASRAESAAEATMRRSPESTTPRFKTFTSGWFKRSSLEALPVNSSTLDTRYLLLFGITIKELKEVKKHREIRGNFEMTVDIEAKICNVC